MNKKGSHITNWVPYLIIILESKQKIGCSVLLTGWSGRGIMGGDRQVNGRALKFNILFQGKGKSNA